MFTPSKEDYLPMIHSARCVEMYIIIIYEGYSESNLHSF
jgi:hypothetical protein